jgi:hypothetical protein
MRAPTTAAPQLELLEFGQNKQSGNGARGGACSPSSFALASSVASVASGTAILEGSDTDWTQR